MLFFIHLRFFESARGRSLGERSVAKEVNSPLRFDFPAISHPLGRRWLDLALGLKETYVVEKKWKSYEDVAAYLLNVFADDFGLGKVEGKQLVPGASGTKWEIDAKGYSESGDAFMIIECKRYTTSQVNQEILAGLAFRISDTGASGGIVVTPFGFQEGAKKVAAHTGIQMVTLNQDCTRTDYVLRFLNKICFGLSDTVHFEDHLTITFFDRDGNVIVK
jgi:hypothetical protein